MSDAVRDPLLVVEAPPVRIQFDTTSDFEPPRPERPPHFAIEALEARVSPTSGVALFEEVEYQLTIEIVDAVRFESSLALRTIDSNLLEHVRRRSRAPVWQGPLRFRSFVGDFGLDVLLDGRRHVSLLFEVFPTKLTYLEDHRALVEEVASHERALPFALVAPTTVVHSIADSDAHRTSTEWLGMLRHEQRSLTRALGAIVRHPHGEIRRESLVRPAAQVRRASSRSAAWLARHPNRARRDGPPSHLIDERRIVSRDTAENRYVIGRVRAWRSALERLLRLEARLAGGFAETKELLRATTQAADFAGLELGARPCSHVLQHNLAYREFVRIDRALTRALERAHSGKVSLTLKALHRLYEYWVLLEVHATLAALGFECPRSGPPVDYSEHRTDLSPAGKLEYARADGARATLTYQGLFTDAVADDEDVESELALDVGELRSLTAPQHPDGVLVLNFAHVPYPVCIVLDAKYRLSRNGVAPRTADVNVMHRYRDALLMTAAAPNDFVQGVAKAWFIYPGDPTGLPRDPRRVAPSPRPDARERLWRAAFSLGVGAIPALPGRGKLLRSALRHVVGATPGSLERGRPRTIHAGQVRLRGTAPCLWAVVPDERRLVVHERASLYHFPADRLATPEVVDYLLLGVRKKEGDRRSVVYPSLLYRVEYARSCTRGQLPRDYRRELGSTSFRHEPPRYHLFRLRDRIALERASPVTLSAEREELFAIRTISETLARLAEA